MFLKPVKRTVFDDKLEEILARRAKLVERLSQLDAKTKNRTEDLIAQLDNDIERLTNIKFALQAIVSL